VSERVSCGGGGGSEPENSPVPRADKEITMEIYESFVVRTVSCVLTCSIPHSVNDRHEKNLYEWEVDTTSELKRHVTYTCIDLQV